MGLLDRPTGWWCSHTLRFGCQVVKSAAELVDLKRAGERFRSTGATNMNEHSSRSHAIFIVTVETVTIAKNGKPVVRVGSLNMVDLAGSERQSKTHSEGQRFEEAKHINTSLTALGNVISALTDAEKRHVSHYVLRSCGLRADLVPAGTVPRFQVDSTTAGVLMMQWWRACVRVCVGIHLSCVAYVWCVSSHRSAATRRP